MNLLVTGALSGKSIGIANHTVELILNTLATADQLEMGYPEEFTRIYLKTNDSKAPKCADCTESVEEVLSLLQSDGLS